MKGRDRPLESTRTTSRTLTLLATAILLALALIGLSPTPALQPVRGVLEAAVAPLQHAVSAATYNLDSWIQTATAMHEQTAEIAQLREDNARLQTENAQLRGLPAENATLRQMLGFQREQPDLHTLPASVVGRDPSGLARILVLDHGTADGVREGMAVTSPGGFLLGRVSKATEHDATVLLIDDVDSSIAAVVDRTNVAVVVWGEAQNGGRLVARHLAQNADVGRGDLLKTSGIGGSFPRGLLLGQIYEIHQKSFEKEEEAVAYPLADSNAIDQVLVILGAGGPNPAPGPGLPPTPDGGATATPGLPPPLYPVPPTATTVPTRTPPPTITPVPTLTPTPIPR